MLKRVLIRLMDTTKSFLTKQLIPSIFFFLPVQRDKIVFINFNGKGYGCNPKYIAAEILRQGLPWDLVWLVNDSNEKFPKGIRTAPFRKWKGLLEVATAKVVVTNVKNDLCLKKKKGQYIIQTWHSSYSAKKVEKEVEDKLDPQYVKESKHNSEQTDLFLSNSTAMSDCYRKAYWCNCEILECGLPRNDILFSKDEARASIIRNNLGIDTQDKIVLYAPTFRDDGSVHAYSLDCLEVLNTLRKNGENWKMIVRLHPNVTTAHNIFPKSPLIIDATTYSDMQELLLISDILITDYSSTPFEFAIMKKQVFIYVPDFEEYQRTRGLKKAFFDSPYPVCKTNEELLSRVEKYTPKEAEKEATEFVKLFGGVDKGDASKQTVNRIAAVISGTFTNSIKEVKND